LVPISNLSTGSGENAMYLAGSRKCRRELFQFRNGHTARANALKNRLTEKIDIVPGNRDGAAGGN
jgi:hypothetical protein